jgi:hypothetical protein
MALITTPQEQILNASLELIQALEICCWHDEAWRSEAMNKALLGLVLESGEMSNLVNLSSSIRKFHSAVIRLQSEIS